MVSKYPNAIDGYSDIRVVRDSVEEVLARDHNDNRSAVVAIEQTLGIQPQGLYGTVVARLDQSDTDFGDHIDGTAHRHITNHIDYPGSSPKTFADGYAMVPSRLGSTLNEFVARLGAFTPAGATGGDKIGTTPYVTEHSKYAFPGTSLRSHAVATGAFLDENAMLLERTLDSFIVDGMEVTDPFLTGETARIAAGHIVSDGRLLRYNGGDLEVPWDIGTFYVWARISNGNVLVGINDSTLPDRDPLNPFVLLKRIERVNPGPAIWDATTDIRRFGVFTNDKNFFSVGGPNSVATDGYGCDFISLKGAVDYIRAMAGTVEYNVPRKIVLMDDVEISNDDDLEIVLDVMGLEIDGCGKSIIMAGSPTKAVFLINTNQIRIHDLTIISSTAATSYDCFAHIGITDSIDDVQIIRCGMKTAFGTPAPTSFLSLGNPAGEIYISNALIANNIVSVSSGGIVYQTGSPYAPILSASRIIGNHIYQDTFVTTPFSAIQASEECVISDNIITGGFGYGISIHSPIDTVVSNNLITGTDFDSAYMSVGIGLWVSNPSGDAYGALVSGNIIKGINNGFNDGYGIDAQAGEQTGRQTIITDNIIDNSGITHTYTHVRGIKVGRYEVPVIGNKIILMGFPIYQAGFVVDNEIYGDGGAGVGSGIECVPSAPTATVCNNRIYNFRCDGSAINVNESHRAVVAGNVIYDCIGNAGINMNYGEQAIIVGNLISHSILATTTYGIINISNDSIVCTNTVVNHESGAFIGSGAGINKTSFIGNKAYNCGGCGISVPDATYCVIANNSLVIDDPTLNPTTAITGFSSNCMVSGNVISGYAAGGYYGISGNTGRSTLVVNNLISDLHANTSGAINMSGGWLDIIVSGNIICNTKYTGITMSNSARSVVSGNLLFGTTDSRSGIIDVGQYSVVANNAILGYGNGGSTNKGISLMDAYSSAVIGNTIVADLDLDWGIYLDVSGLGTICNLIANNVLYGLAHRGIDLNTGLSGRHIVANNIITGTSQSNNEPGIDNLSSQSLAVGNNISLANGDGIRVILGLGYLLSIDGSAVISNIVSNPSAYGINVDSVGGPDGYDSCLIATNYIGSADYAYGGINLKDSWRATITGNFVKNFNIGIRLLNVSQGCSDNIICGNNVQQNPDGGAVTGILIDAGCINNHVVGNFVFGSAAGIRLYANQCSICSNHITKAQGVGIDATDTIDVAIIGNYVGPGGGALGSDGINIFGCRKTLVTGNLAFGYLLGMSFRVDNMEPADGLVMSGNLARDGFAAPNMGDGLGGTWPTGKITDVDCRYITP
jgi:parallel beta-helix repeat protein